MYRTNWKQDLWVEILNGYPIKLDNDPINMISKGKA